jgi:hypothetical protein
MRRLPVDAAPACHEGTGHRRRTPAIAIGSKASAQERAATLLLLVRQSSRRAKRDRFGAWSSSAWAS